MAKPTLTSQVLNDELTHVVSVAGKPFQSFTTLKLAMAALLLAMAASGCQTIERYPRTSAFIAGSLVLTAGGALRHDHTDADRHIPTPSVNCANGGCR